MLYIVLLIETYCIAPKIGKLIYIMILLHRFISDITVNNFPENYGSPSRT